MGRARLTAALLLGLGAGSLHGAEPIVSGTFLSGGVQRRYAVYAPPASAPRALVIVLHGSGGSGREMVGKWRDLARREGFVVAGPDATDRSEWTPPQDGPVLLRDLVETLKPQAIDPRRVYLFGYSAGAIFALYMGLVESEYFAAVASHAGAFTGEADLGFLKSVRRNIPLHISAGTKDDLFPQSVVLATVQRLQNWGIPTTVHFVPGEPHSYRFYGEINDRAWGFLRDRHLDADPVFTPIEFSSPPAETR